MEFLISLLAVTAFVIFIVVTPGPDTAVVIKNSIFKSRADGIATTTGVVVGNIFYVSLVLLGLSAVIVNSVFLFSVLKYLGAAYLIYLGVQLLFSRSKAEKTIPPPTRNVSTIAASFREGLLTNLGNPKFMLFLLALFTQIIDPSTPLIVQALYAYQIPLVALVWFSTLSIVLTTEVVRVRISKFMHVIERLTGVVLIALGIKTALSSTI